MEHPTFSRAEVEKMGISGEALAYYVRKGTLERLASGVYFDPTRELKIDFKWQDLTRVAYSVKDGVICLLSALDYYGLTQEIPRQFWIAIPHDKRVPVIPNTRFVRFRNINLGKMPIKVGEVKLQIFDKERTVVDSFRYLDKEVAVKALRKLVEQGLDFEKISSYATKLRVDIEPYVYSVTA